MTKRLKTTKNNLRREEIIDQAAKIFKEKGFKNATLQDVADQLELTAPAVYYHVKNKEEILFEIYKKTMNLGLETLRSISYDSSTSTIKLKRIIYEYTTLVINNIEMFTVYFQEKHHLAPDNYDFITNQEREFALIIRKVYQQGIDNGEFISLNPAVVTNGILGMCSWIYKWYEPSGSLTADDISGIFFNMVSPNLIKFTSDK